METKVGMDMKVKHIQEGVIRAVACSSDGRFVAVAGSEGVTLLAGDTMDTVNTFPISGTVECVAFSPDGSRICAGLKAGKVMIMDVDNGPVKTITTQAPGFGTAAWSPDGKRICLGQYEPTLTLIDTGSWKSQTLDPDVYDDSGRTAVRFTADGEAILSTAGSQLMRWQKTSARYVAEVVLHAAQAGRFTDLVPGLDGAFAALEDAEPKCYLHKWDSDTGEKTKAVQLPDYFSKLGWGENDQCFVAGELAGSRLVYRTATWLAEASRAPKDIGPYAISCMEAFPLSGFLLIGTREGFLLY